MPVAGGSGGSGGKGTKKGGRSQQPILVLPPAAVPTTQGATGGSAAGPSSTAGSRGSGSGVKSGSTSGSRSSASTSSSSSSYDYAAAQRQRDLATRDRYVEDASQLSGQIRALRHALGPKGEFKDALKKRLGNIDLVLGEQLADLDKAELARSASLATDEANNEKAAADSSMLNDTNRIRERASSIVEAMAQGAGESDTLKAQMMSLRNFDANQNEINRAFHDSQRSINASRLDLALDTHNARVNMVTEANADREQLWTTFYNQTSETQTQLGNALGQQAEYYGLAREAARNAGIKAGTVKTGSSSSTSSSSGTRHGGRSGGQGSVKGGPVNGPRPDIGGPAGPVRGMLGRTRAGSTVPSGVGLGAVTGTEVDYGDAPGGTRSGLRSLGGGKGKGKGGGKNYGKGLKGDEARATAQSDQAFMAAANAQGRAWKNPGLPSHLENWQPPTITEEQLNNGTFANARTNVALAKPEGATLRKW
jgi:hypothetical protein